MKNFQQPTNFRKIYLVLSIFFCLNLSLTASDEILFRINKLANWKTYHWGVMNVSGKIIIHPKFEGLGEFQGETALAKSNQKWGVINRKGEFIKKPEFQDVREFENGLAWVIQNCSYWIAYECERGKWGLINTTGEILIPPKYDGVLSEEAPYIPRLFGKPSGELTRDRIFFGKDGYARVFTESPDRFNRISKYGIVNSEGKELIQPKYHKIDFFQNDIAAFSVSEKGIQYGLISISGEIILEPSYRNIESLVPFGEADEVIWSASYYDKDEKRVLHKLLSKDGKELSELRFHQVKPFQNGLAFARKTHTSLWGQIDRTGNWSLEPTYKSLSDIIPKEETKKKYIVELDGKRYYREKEENALWFSERKLDPYDKVEREFWGFSDLAGNVIYPAQSFEKGFFSEGVSWISLRYRKKNNEHIVYQALIDEQGKELTLPIYLYTLPFRNGLGVAQVFGGNWGYLNKQGKVIWWIK
ncbi:MAG: WG repeat-containing protein [Leptospiraceae bacterium]|nr:WG repeat-containing protein [Leptospiraceae bacterium]